jgi:hypothetical protein
MARRGGLLVRGKDLMAWLGYKYIYIIFIYINNIYICIYFLYIYLSSPSLSIYIYHPLYIYMKLDKYLNMAHGLLYWIYISN